MTTPMPMRLQLPAPGFPMVTRVISNALFPQPTPPPPNPIPPPREPEPVAWLLGAPHPFVPSMRIVRMFVVPDGVAIYSAADGSPDGMRNLIPMHWVRFVEEAMPIDIFVEELSLAEAGDESDEPDAPMETPGDPSDPQRFADGNDNPALA